jgi:hypothetical protein
MLNTVSAFFKTNPNRDQLVSFRRLYDVEYQTPFLPNYSIIGKTGLQTDDSLKCYPFVIGISF